MSDIKVTMTSNDRDLLASFVKQQAALDKQIRKYDELQKKTTEAAKVTRDGFDNATVSIGKTVGRVGDMVLGMQGVMKLAAGISAAMADVEQRAAKAAAKLKELAPSREEAFFNAGPETALKMAAEAKRISAEQGVKRSDVQKTMSSAMSAKGALPDDAAFKATEAGHRMFKLNPEAAALFAGTALDIQQIAPADVTAEDAIGFAQGVGQKARVTDPKMLATNVMPAVGNLVRLDEGRGWKENAALVGALTQVTGDQTGASSATAATSLGIQLEEFMPGNMTTAERIEKLQQDEKARAQFLDKASFEVKYRPAIKDLLTPGSKAAATYDNAKRDIPELAAGDITYNKLLAAKKADVTLSRAERQQADEVSLENFYAENPEAQRQAEIRRHTVEAPQAAGIPAPIRGFSAFRQWTNSMDNFLFGAGKDESQLALEHAQSNLAMGQRAGLDPEAIDLLRKSVAALEKLVEDSKRKDQTQKVEVVNRNPGLGGQKEAGANQ